MRLMRATGNFVFTSTGVGAIGGMGSSGCDMSGAIGGEIGCAIGCGMGCGMDCGIGCGMGCGIDCGMGCEIGSMYLCSVIWGMGAMGDMGATSAARARRDDRRAMSGSKGMGSAYGGTYCWGTLPCGAGGL